ncbi:MAG TPA: FTR1 family protein, partial [Herpetosiphonaceae bacterium]
GAGKGWPIQQVEQAGLAAGYFEILAAPDRDQRGEPALAAARETWAALLKDAAAGADALPALDQVEAQLKGFRAAPLSKDEQARRAGQLLRFVSLVPVEYGRGVKNGVVTRDFEIREATTFYEGAAAAFADLRSLLEPIDGAKVEQVAGLMAQLEAQLAAAAAQQNVPDPDAVEATATQTIELLRGLMPQEWQQNSTSGDFDVIDSMLDQMQTAAAAGQYDLAESARLEAYAILEAGPEARLIVFAPQFKTPIEDLFWYGQGEQKGLARLIGDKAPATTIRASRLALNEQLEAAEKALSGSTAPAAVATNAAIIVFREGLEAVLILASLMGSFKLGEQRRLRRPLWIGAAAAFVASILTWMLARGLLVALARYGERLEAVVSLIAIGVLLLITNWFFHKVYWTGWMANFHAKKRRIVGGEAGLWLGLIALGFSSIYREGFESVLFLQALVLEAGSSVVLSGVALGLGGAFLVGILVFALQAKLPHKKMLIVTGVMIGGVLLVMVGNTAHVLQVVGWLPIHPIRDWTLPYWSGLWFGFYATYEGIALQVLAATFVIGSYVLAERLQHDRTEKAVSRQSAPQQSA